MSSLRKESMCRCHSMWVKYHWTQGWRQFSFPRVIPTINSEGHLKKGGGGGNLLQSPSLGLSCSDGAHEWSGLWRGILLLLFLKPLFKSTIQSSAPWTGLMPSLVGPLSRWSTLSEGAFDLQMNSQNAFEFRMSSAVSEGAFQAKNRWRQGVSQRKRGMGFGFWTFSWISQYTAHICLLSDIKLELTYQNGAWKHRTNPNREDQTLDGKNHILD